MQIEKLKTTLTELEQELRSIQTVDEETRRVLEEAIGTIRATLNENTPAATEDTPAAGEQSLTDRLSAAVVQFEGQYPTLTVIIGRLVDGLSQMGI